MMVMCEVWSTGTQCWAVYIDDEYDHDGDNNDSNG